MSEFANLIDTALNVVVFAFVAALIWLYLHEDSNDE